MSGFFKPRNIAIALGAGLGVFYVLPRTSAAKLNPLQTPGVQNIEDRWSAGGGGHKHTPGVATQRGNPEMTGTDQIKPRGIPYPHYKENVADQKVAPEQPNKLTKKWWETHYGQEKGR